MNERGCRYKVMYMVVFRELISPLFFPLVNVSYSLPVCIWHGV